MPGTLRLTDVAARLRLFAGPLPRWATGSATTFPAVPARPRSLPPDVEEHLAGLPASDAARVRDPAGRAAPPPVWTPRALTLPGGGAARQVSPTTCGSAVLAVLALAGDPRLALRLALADDPAAGFAGLQQTLQRACTTGPSGLPTWPRGLGTPPWAAARRARYGAVRYTHRVVGGADHVGRSSRGARGSGGDEAPGGRVLPAALRAAAAGVPVPLYTGGDLSGGISRALPRHVVLLTAVHAADTRGPRATLYEPSSGSLHTLPLDLLRRGAAPGDARGLAARTRALGGWPHVVWAVLPCTLS
ncbi:hypothetical protein ACNHYB_06430 [Isoptericola jiangsuensis]|uniref:hypothetical protein n=1 Tax=Isoptericola jiangsuensis TaxID=548579 RepID=UPI003AAEA686